MLVPLAILLATLGLLSLGRLPRLGARRHRAWVALAGGLAMAAAGGVGAQQALAAVRLELLALLFGMLAIAAGLEAAGIFDRLSRGVVARARTQHRLLAATLLTSALLSALLLNDAVVLVLTPVLVKAARLLHVDAMPYLAAEVFGANLGSVATPVGNPQNAYIAVASGIGFEAWVLAMLPLALAGLAAAYAITALVFRRSLAAPLGPGPPGPAGAGADAGAGAGAETRAAAPGDARDTRFAFAVVLVLAAVLVGFVEASSLGIGLGPVALAGGLAALAAALALRGPRAAAGIARRVDWGVLGLFVGLFWLVEGFRGAGLGAALAAGLAGGGSPSVPALAAWAAGLSQLVSNVPAVLLLAPALERLGSERLWLALAGASTLAGNATLVGAAANVIVAETARAHGAAFRTGRFMLAGVPLTMVSLLAMLALLGPEP